MSADAALIAIHGEEVGVSLEERRTPTARLIADPGRSTFDHVGAEIAEQHRAIRSRERLRHVDDFDSVQRSLNGQERSRLVLYNRALV